MIKPYGVYLIEFPFSDLAQSKLRPALALTSENRAGEAIFCFISSQLFSKDEVDIEVRPSKQNGLKMPSIIKIGKVATLSNRYEKRVKGRIGQLEHRYVSRVKCNLKNLFHLSTSYAVERSSRKNRGVKRGVFKDTPSEHRRF